MPGSSFGDYFKRGREDAGWALLTNSLAAGIYGLDGKKENPGRPVYFDDDEAVRRRRLPGCRRAESARHGRQRYWSMNYRTVRAVIGDLLRPRT